jgi:hypothetical protein
MKTSKTKSSQVLDFDEFFDNEDLYAQEIPVDFDDDETSDEPKKRGRKPKIKTTKSKDVYNLPTASLALSINAKKKLESYLKKTPQYRILNEQINLLLEEYKNYKKLGNLELAEKTQELISDLSGKKKKFVKLYKTSTQKDEKEVAEIKAKLESSETLKDLKTDLKALEEDYRKLNPNTLAYQISEFRKMLNILDDSDVVDFEDEEMTDFDTYLQNFSENVTKQEYINLCGHIADLLDLTPGEIMKMRVNEIRKALKAANPAVEELKTKVRKVLKTIKDKNGDIVDLKTEILNVLKSSKSITDTEGFKNELIRALNRNDIEIEKLLLDIKDVLSLENSAIEDLKNKIERKKIEINNESNKIKGQEDITDIIFNIFDLSEVPEEQPKEMLAAANIPYVKAIAYNTCNKLNMLHLFDDAVAYGLVGLTVAINRWYRIQKFEDTVISFTGFAHRDVSGAIKRGLYEITMSGRISGSVMATIEHKRNKQLKAYLENNPELKDVPREMLDSLLDGVIDDKVEPAITESAYMDMVGGSEGSDNADIWTNVAKYEDEKMLLGKLDLINSLKALFGLFRGTNPNTKGANKIFEKPIFDKYDYKLFKLVFGFEYKRESLGENKTTKNTNYNQDEIAEILSKYYKANGIEQSFTQSAISTRIKKLREKLKDCVEKFPIIKAGLQFIVINTAANNLDATFDDFEKQKLITDQDVENNDFNNNLSNKSLKLSDVFSETSENPLDEEIANYFENYQGI